jgi:hypothetical protein
MQRFRKVAPMNCAGLCVIVQGNVFADLQAEVDCGSAMSIREKQRTITTNSRCHANPDACNHQAYISQIIPKKYRRFLNVTHHGL